MHKYYLHFTDIKIRQIFCLYIYKISLDTEPPTPHLKTGFYDLQMEVVLKCSRKKFSLMK